MSMLVNLRLLLWSSLRFTLEITEALRQESLGNFIEPDRGNPKTLNPGGIKIKCWKDT